MLKHRDSLQKSLCPVVKYALTCAALSELLLLLLLSLCCLVVVVLLLLLLLSLSLLLLVLSITITNTLTIITTFAITATCAALNARQAITTRHTRDTSSDVGVYVL